MVLISRLRMPERRAPLIGEMVDQSGTADVCCHTTAGLCRSGFEPTAAGPLPRWKKISCWLVL